MLPPGPEGSKSLLLAVVGLVEGPMLLPVDDLVPSFSVDDHGVPDVHRLTHNLLSVLVAVH